MNPDAEVRDRAKRLYQFVRELIMLRHVPVRNYRQYEQYIPLDELPPRPDCYFIARNDFEDDEQEVWLEVRCPKIENYPEPPTALADWLDPSQLSDATLDMPLLLSGSAIGVEDEPSEDESTELSAFEVEPPLEIREAWEQYIQEGWWPWAERTRPKYRAKKLYDDLFRMYQRQEHLGETYEVVAGFGLLSWRASEAVEIQRHLVTVALSLELDSRRQILSLRPNASGLEPKLEDDMLDPTQRPPTELRNEVKDILRNMSTGLWVSEHVHEVLARYANALEPDTYGGSDPSPKSGGSEPVVTFSPFLILRRRGNEGLIGLVDAIIQSIEAGAEIPPAVIKQICIVGQHDRQGTEGGSVSSAEPEDETYFPLPANREQRRIVQHLASSDGIVVEGPPGTGKSLSIANLICHLLATGKRVLVTSHTARALQVLRDKIPEPIRPLCVQALSNDAKGMQALEYSVKGVTDRHLTWDLETAEADMNRLADDLSGARERLQEAIHDLRAIREAEVYRHDRIAGTYSGTLADIARRIKSEEHLGIISDNVEGDRSPLCTADDFRDLLAVLSTHQSQVREPDADEPPDTSNLTPPDRFREISDGLAASEAAAKSGEQATYCELAHRLRDIGPETRCGLATGIEAHAARLLGLRRQRTETWLEEAINDIFGERDRAWNGRLRDSRDRLDALRRIPIEVLDARVNGHADLDPDVLHYEAYTLMEYLQGRKGKGIGFRPLLPAKVKTALKVLEGIRINGEPCTDIGPLRVLIQWTEAARLIVLLDNEWASTEHLEEDAFSRKMEVYEDLCEPLTELLDLRQSSRTLSKAIADACGDPGPCWHDHRELDVYLKALSRADALDDLQRRQLDWTQLVGTTLQTVNIIPDPSLCDAFEGALDGRDANAYGQAYRSLEDLRRQWERTTAAAKTLHSLTKAAPALAARVLENPSDKAWQKLLQEWEASWAWAVARTWLMNMVAPDADQRATARVNTEQKRAQELLADLASAKAWAYCFRRLTEEQRVHLQAWSLAVKRIGKGTGKYANQHRRAARENIGHCQSAIPAWIMPIYRVAESIRPDNDRFDVAIIDEASQSGPEALALLFLADKVVVVGDDKQISPDPFTRIEDVNRLRRELISDLPTNDALGPLSSFFDLAKIRYPARIRLVEHFRCMPEIIQFSNDLCYSAEPLLPLRQFGAGRLDPVVSAVHVPRGFTTGKTQKVNRPEATAIARKIAELMRDERYNGKTFGVISLLGNRQARMIENELMGLVDPKELHARLCVCGEAYAFQGDERDVVFLSMVSAPGPDSRIGVLAKGSDERRFNVAMSRAKDQVWLFHSATLNDLSPSDLRSQLLRYCQHPRRPHLGGNIDVEEIAKLARTSNRSIDGRPIGFDSWFEVDVFLRLVREGYLVVPQYDVNGYSIDLAVIGQMGKLAVECDGDHWHGPEQWESDAARQRDLERCGWPFFRVRESSFYLDRDSALEPLWQALAKHGIRPLGAVDQRDEVATDGGVPLSANHRIPEPVPSVIEPQEDEESVGQDPNLPAYPIWVSHPIPNPRSAPRESVFEALFEIVGAEGPATWRRVFECYRIGLGLGRLTGPTRGKLEDRAQLAVLTRQLVEVRETDSDDWYDRVVYLPDSFRVRLRQRGPRNLEDIPASEIAELIRAKGLVDLDEESQFKHVLASYGLHRRTEKARTHLRAAALLACENQSAVD